MTIISQLIQFYLLLCARIQQSIFVIILKASTSIVRSAVPFVLRPFPVETSPVFLRCGSANWCKGLLKRFVHQIIVFTNCRIFVVAYFDSSC